ncbi:MAG: hypothetical protein C0483_14765 [Pirellula sp.]|nr:hypothetical protein [Pirellula sp.]
MKSKVAARVTSLLLVGLVCAAEARGEDVAKQGEVLLNDDFAGTTLNPAWKVTHPTFTVVDGVLQGSQTKPTHGAVAQVNVGAKNVGVEFQFKLHTASSINAVLDDDDYKEGHAGHICRVSLRPKQVFLGDDKERMRHTIEVMRKDPARKAEVDALVAGRSLNIPARLVPEQWYRLRLQVIGDELSVSLDDKPLGTLKSSGIGHPIKTTFHFTVSGGDALFDDVRLWKIAPQ